MTVGFDGFPRVSSFERKKERTKTVLKENRAGRKGRVLQCYFEVFWTTNTVAESRG